MRTLLLSIALFLTASVVAQKQAFTAQVSKTTVSTGETFRYVLTLVNQEGQINLPQLSDFILIQGPSTSTSMQIINGKTSQEYSETYYLRAKKAGTLTIPPASARTASGVVKTEAITIKAVQGAAPQEESSNSDFFSTVSVSKRKVYVGEPLVATFKIFMRYRDLRDAAIEYPDLEGFWSEIVETNEGWNIELVNGRQYRTITTKHEVLFPQKSGELVIDPFRIEAILSDGFFSRGRRMQAASKPVKIEVLPLPAHSSEGFLGTYPSLKVDTDLSKTELKTNEAINLDIKFSGKGNIKLLGAPEFVVPQDFEFYEPKVKDKISVNASGESGSRKFEYVFIPRTAGQFTIPEVRMTYFESASGKIKELLIPEMNFSVEKGAGDSGLAYTFDSKTDVNVLNQDIRHIRPTTAFKSPSSALFGSPLFFGLLSLPIFLLGGLIVFQRKRKGEAQDRVGTRQKKAGKMARTRLSKATQLCISGDSQAFYQEIHSALLGYLGDKFRLPVSELSTDKVAQVLTDSAGPEMSKKTVDILALCEQARYAPVTQASEKELLDQTSLIISTLEKEVS